MTKSMNSCEKWFGKARYRTLSIRMFFPTDFRRRTTFCFLDSLSTYCSNDNFPSSFAIVAWQRCDGIRCVDDVKRLCGVAILRSVVTQRNRICRFDVRDTVVVVIMLL